MAVTEADLLKAQSEINRLNILLRAAYARINKLETDLLANKSTNDLFLQFSILFNLSKSQSLIIESLYTVYPNPAAFESIYAKLYGQDGEIDPNTLKVLVSNLRKKIPLENSIQNVWGVGYRLTPEAYAYFSNGITKQSVPIEISKSEDVVMEIHNSRPPLPRG